MLWMFEASKEMRNLDPIGHFLLCKYLVEPCISRRLFYVSVASLSWSVDRSWWSRALATQLYELQLPRCIFV